MANIQIPIIVRDWASSKDNPNADDNENGYACTLLARDWKGFSNYGCNGVIVINEKE